MKARKDAGVEESGIGAVHSIDERPADPLVLWVGQRLKVQDKGARE